MLGALGWNEVGRVGACVNIAALQRVQKITNRDVLALNVLLRYLRRQPAFLKYEHLTEPLALICVSDSAYRREVSEHGETDGLAMRGAVFLRIERRGRGDPGGRCQIVDFYSRKHRLVTRSTWFSGL